MLFITGSQSSTINHSFERNALQVALKEEVTISTAANIGNVSVGHKNDLKRVYWYLLKNFLIIYHINNSRGNAQSGISQSADLELILVRYSQSHVLHPGIQTRPCL